MTSSVSPSLDPDQFMDRATALLAAPAVVGPADGLDPHALLPLYLADGLLEAVEWANDGVGSDEAACMWLAALRWHRTVTGAFPPGAPEPLTRMIDDELAALRPTADGADPALLTVISRVDMGTPQRPQHDDGAAGWALLCATVPGLLPHVTPGTRRKLAVDAAALVAPRSAFDAAAVLGPAVFEMLAAPDPLGALRELGEQAPEDGTGARLRTAVSAAAGHSSAADAASSHTAGDERMLAAALCGAVHGTAALGDGWERRPGAAVVLAAAERWRRLVFAA
ncbi:hypothetical protein [Zhihengliuella halotolerans]|nr:hypothetical protein [Zhihengliuella halotolerans]